VDVLQNSPSLDRIFLLSGDGDFDLLVEAVQTKHGVPRGWGLLVSSSFLITT